MAWVREDVRIRALERVNNFCLPCRTNSPCPSLAQAGARDRINIIISSRSRSNPVIQVKAKWLPKLLQTDRDAAVAGGVRKPPMVAATGSKLSRPQLRWSNCLHIYHGKSFSWVIGMHCMVLFRLWYEKRTSGMINDGTGKGAC